MINKTYCLNNFIISPSILTKRINKITAITKDTLVPVYFEKKQNLLIRKTNRIKKTNIEYGKLLEHHKLELANILQKSFDNKIVHGDINKKNIIISETGQLCLIDWEPSLIQFINNKETLMATHPFIDSDDFIKKKLTIKTDLLCFFKVITNCSNSFFKTKKWANLQNMALKSKLPFNFILYQQVKD